MSQVGEAQDGFLQAIKILYEQSNNDNFGFSQHLYAKALSSKGTDCLRKLTPRGNFYQKKIHVETTGQISEKKSILILFK